MTYPSIVDREYTKNYQCIEKLREEISQLLYIDISHFLVEAKHEYSFHCLQHNIDCMSDFCINFEAKLDELQDDFWEKMCQEYDDITDKPTKSYNDLISVKKEMQELLKKIEIGLKDYKEDLYNMLPILRPMPKGENIFTIGLRKLDGEIKKINDASKKEKYPLPSF